MRCCHARRAGLALCCASLLWSLAAWAEQASALRMVVEGYKSPRSEVYLQGEPIAGRMIIENVSDQALKVVYKPAPRFRGFDTGWRFHLEGDMWVSTCEEIAEETSGPFVSVLEAGQRIEWPYQMTRFLLPGRYAIWITYDPVGAGHGRFVEQEGLPKLRVESNRLQVEVVAPTGIDAQAFEKYWARPREAFEAAARRNGVAVSKLEAWMLDDYEKGYACSEWWMTPGLPDEFPTSVYAGWVLLRGANVFAAEVGPLPSSDLSMVPEGPMRDRVRQAKEGGVRYSSRRVEELRNYLARRPDFPGRDEMRFIIALEKARVGDLGGARTIVESLIAQADAAPWLRDVSRALQRRVEEAAGRQQ